MYIRPPLLDHFPGLEDEFPERIRPLVPDNFVKVYPYPGPISEHCELVPGERVEGLDLGLVPVLVQPFDLIHLTLLCSVVRYDQGAGTGTPARRLDQSNRSLFTGDTFYPDLLFAFIDGSWGESDLQKYHETIRELTALVPELDYLYCSHGKALAAPEVLYDVAKAFKSIINKSTTKCEDIEIYWQKLKIYHFDGFSIVTRK